MQLRTEQVLFIGPVGVYHELIQWATEMKIGYEFPVSARSYSPSERIRRFSRLNARASRTTSPVCHPARNAPRQTTPRLRQAKSWSCHTPSPTTYTVSGLARFSCGELRACRDPCVLEYDAPARRLIDAPRPDPRNKAGPRSLTTAGRPESRTSRTGLFVNRGESLRAPARRSSEAARPGDARVRAARPCRPGDPSRQRSYFQVYVLNGRPFTFGLAQTSQVLPLPRVTARMPLPNFCFR